MIRTSLRKRMSISSYGKVKHSGGAVCGAMILILGFYLDRLLCDARAPSGALPCPSPPLSLAQLARSLARRLRPRGPRQLRSGPRRSSGGTVFSAAWLPDFVLQESGVA